MTTLIHSLIDGYNDIMRQRDPRLDGWFLMDSPAPTLVAIAAYVYGVKVLGPRLMRDRQPIHLREVLIVYNAFQVVFSAWIFYEIGMGGWFKGYSLRCQPIDYTNSPLAVRFGMGGWFRGYSYRCQPVDYSNNSIATRMMHASWWYYFSKFTEFLDTIFFVMRKKFEHVSALHVIHHGCMPISVWIGVKFTPGGHSTFFGLLNSFVHVVMYTYYLLAALGERYRRYLWWKKYLTALQMIQFIAIFAHAFQLVFIECNYPRAFMWWIGGHAVLFFFLFSDFYKQAYIIKGKSTKNDVNSKISNGSALKNGIATKMSNGSAFKNGTANGHANGYANGHAGGYSNGHANGHANGVAHCGNKTRQVDCDVTKSSGSPTGNTRSRFQDKLD